MSADDEDDGEESFYRRDPREETGYDTSAPRTRARPTGGVTHWRFVEHDGPAPAVGAGTIGGPNVCKPKSAPGSGTLGGCGEPATVLHQDPRNNLPERVLCSACTGRIMRERVGDARPSEPTPEPRRSR